MVFRSKNSRQTINAKRPVCVCLVVYSSISLFVRSFIYLLASHRNAVGSRTNEIKRIHAFTKRIHFGRTAFYFIIIWQTKSSLHTHTHFMYWIKVYYLLSTIYFIHIVETVQRSTIRQFCNVLSGTIIISENGSYDMS